MPTVGNIPITIEMFIVKWKNIIAIAEYEKILWNKFVCFAVLSDILNNKMTNNEITTNEPKNPHSSPIVANI